MSENAEELGDGTVYFPNGENPELSRWADRLHPLVRRGALEFLALYTGDHPRFFIAASAGSEPPAREDGSADERRAHDWVGRQLYYLTTELEPDFADLRTGALIRTVLRVPEGSVFLYLIEPGVHVFGVTRSVDRFDRVGLDVAASVQGLRRMVRFAPLEYGAWPKRLKALSHPLSVRSLSGPADSVPVSVGADYVYRPQDVPDGVDTKLRAALGVAGLHYVAYYDGAAAPYCLDIFQHPALARHFRGPTPTGRRYLFGRLGQTMPDIVARMNESVRAVMRGEVVQLVLDVEQGALYITALPGERFLVGATLDQSKVTDADESMAELGTLLVDAGQ